MEDVGSVERMLRDTPGVLDCSVGDEGIAVVVHPEVDPGPVEVRIRAALAAAGDQRTLLVVGGMSTGASTRTSVAPGPRWRNGAGRGPVTSTRLPPARSSMPVLGFAVLVVAALTVAPMPGRSSPGRGGGSTTAAPAPPPAVHAADSGRSFGPLAIVDEPAPARLGAAPRSSVSAAGRLVGLSAGAVAASAGRLSAGLVALVALPPPSGSDASMLGPAAAAGRQEERGGRSVQAAAASPRPGGRVDQGGGPATASHEKAKAGKGHDAGKAGTAATARGKAGTAGTDRGKAGTADRGRRPGAARGGR